MALSLAMTVGSLVSCVGPLGSAGSLLPPAAGSTTHETSIPLEAQPADNPITLIGHTPEQSAAVDELLGRFADAGLDLPPITIAFWSSRDHCGGHGGLHRGLGDIEVCLPSSWMIAHEMAHAWDVHNLSDPEREAYRRLWEAPTWASSEFEWHERAMELAANTIAFAMLNDDPEPYKQIRSFLCTYEALTGLSLPTPLATPC